MAKKKSSGGKPSKKTRKKEPSKASGKKGKASKKKATRKKSTTKASPKKTARKKASGKRTPRKMTPAKSSKGKMRGKRSRKKTTRKKAPRAKTARKKAARRDRAYFEHFRSRLLEERERIGRRLDDLRDELSGLQEMPRELEEWAQEEKDRDILIRLEEREATELRRIQAALERIDDGSYGLCQICGRPIPRDRLEELPTAFRCIDHSG